MKKNLYKYLICSILMSLVSCTSYLDIKPYGKTIPKTPEEFSALLNTHLKDIDNGEEIIWGNVSTSSDLECYADNLDANLTKYPEGSYIPLYVGDGLSRKQYYYERLYRIIRDCNIIFGNMKDDGSKMARNVIGTAYAMRGVCYYHLLRNFCEPAVGNLQGLGVPLVTEFDMEAKPIRSTIAQTAELCISDFEQAIAHSIDDPMFRFDSDVMEGFKARTYFWTGDWKNAAISARELLKKYPLISGDAYKEMIESEIARKGNVIMKSSIIFDSDKQGQYNGTVNYLRSRPLSRKFVELFVEKEKDIRYRLNFDRYRLNTKYPGASLRSAELQLILAESLYHQGKESEALAALNELRRNRIEEYVPFTMQTLPKVKADDIIRQDCQGKELSPLLYAILNERRKELYLEGDRWFELKRNGRPEFWAAKQGRKYTTRQFMYTFPIPVNDVHLVDGLIQNPGYEKVQ